MCEIRLSSEYSRRSFIKGSLGAAAVAAGVPRPAWAEVFGGVETGAAGEHLEVARRAAQWIHASRVETENGITWPADPEQPDTIGNTLYSHGPGVVLFLLELHHATGDRSYLDEAARGADHLIAEVSGDGPVQAGLYVGWTGLAFVLEETYRATRQPKYRRAVETLLSLIANRATEQGSGVTWLQGSEADLTEVTDIVSGAAGTGLGLLYLRDRLGDDRWLDLAERAGRRLVELGQPAHDGLKWAMSPTFPRLMPNFSHGTAGVSYFLARLHEVTGEPTFLHAALQGAKYLSNVATGRREEWKIFHHEPEGEGLFYLSWCHGPAGTARFFHQLNRVTGDDEWMEWVRGGAEGIMQTGVPERRTPGFWNNVSQCCGDAGVGEFFVNLRRMTGDSRYLDFANRVTHNLRRRATETADRIGWRQAEHRVRPELLQTQTGFMQGAAGIGTYFLHLDGLEQGRDPLIRWPDSGY